MNYKDHAVSLKDKGLVAFLSIWTNEGVGTLAALEDFQNGDYGDWQWEWMKDQLKKELDKRRSASYTQAVAR
ncbi:hypothetical protein SEA_OCTOBIEN14_127 [Gordonia phage Octobien14]|uniref:Uncharacterized protein n=1 Tax=Gordonia phage Octobien14 TaxID=2483673 RepID=A0A3G3M9T3_9CAUD|nr:hypothetical protein L3Y22_gp117 [Gordonia phage Octobien14]AYR03262.1 hypothetical protein SEA_OCTOBIEN14_127 [Gordonia phage Octobien14]